MDNYAIQIEKAILSSIIFTPEQFEDIAAKLCAQDFLHLPHQDIFAAMEELHRLELPIEEDFITKKIGAKRHAKREDLLEILTTNPIADIESYVNEVKDRSIKRGLHRLANTIREYSQKDELESKDILDLLQSELYKVTQESENREFREAQEISVATLEHIKKMKERGNSGLTGVDTGFKELNKLTTGFGHGDLVIVAARPAMGKTTFVLNMAQKALDTGKGVAFFSLEMPAEQLMLRLLSAKTSIALQNLRIGNLNDEEWSRLSGACDSMASKPLFVDDNSLLTIHQLRSKLRKLKSRHPEVGMAVIDYLQLMSGTSGKDRHQEVSEISRGLKMLARELEIPIIALSQLNRSLESRSDRRPMLSDIRESGSIEQDADIILFVYRDEVYNPDSPDKGSAEIIIAKQRNGPIGTVRLAFIGEHTKFANFAAGL